MQLTSGFEVRVNNISFRADGDASAAILMLGSGHTALAARRDGERRERRGCHRAGSLCQYRDIVDSLYRAHSRQYFALGRFCSWEFGDGVVGRRSRRSDSAKIPASKIPAS